MAAYEYTGAEDGDISNGNNFNPTGVPGLGDTVTANATTTSGGNLNVTGTSAANWLITDIGVISGGTFGGNVTVTVIFVPTSLSLAVFNGTTFITGGAFDDILLDNVTFGGVVTMDSTTLSTDCTFASDIKIVTNCNGLNHIQGAQRISYDGGATWYSATSGDDMAIVNVTPATLSNTANAAWATGIAATLTNRVTSVVFSCTADASNNSKVDLRVRVSVDGTNFYTIAGGSLAGFSIGGSSAPLSAGQSASYQIPVPPGAQYVEVDAMGVTAAVTATFTLSY